PPPWRREEEDDSVPTEPGHLRLHGFVSKPEIQKLNRNSIYTFVNGRLIRDRLIQHALTEAYRNILPPTVFPVVLLFLEMPNAEGDVNVHPSKTEVRFRQQSVIHDFLRDSVRAALMKARPVPQFVAEIRAHATASPSLTPGARAAAAEGAAWQFGAAVPQEFALQAPLQPFMAGQFQFSDEIAVKANAAIPFARSPRQIFKGPVEPQEESHCAPAIADDTEPITAIPSLSSLRPLGQLR